MHTYTYQCTFNDCDPAGIMFFANAFTIMHKAYEDLLITRALNVAVFQNQEAAFPIVHSEADYCSPIRLHQKVTVFVSIVKHSEHRFETQYVFHSENDSELIKASMMHVAISKQNGKKVPLPEELNPLFNL